MSYKIRINGEEQHRLKFESFIYNKRKCFMQKTTIMLDTGCYNTMIPSKLAFTSGIPLNMKRSIVIGASVIETEAFIIERIKIDSLEMNSVFMLAANFKGELADTVLLGLNVLNNWKYTVHRRDNLIEFNESYPDMIPNNTNPYRNYFDSYGRYVLAQES